MNLEPVYIHQDWVNSHMIDLIVEIDKKDPQYLEQAEQLYVQMLGWA